ncbi:MAG: c-type cytochrome [Xanthomonadales bacterium]|nr:c-type cytochrome [Xanthomonadales bacterium]
MSCGAGDSSCEIPRRRGAFVMLGVMTAIFIFLSVFSFTRSRNQTVPSQITYGAYTADQGKHIFQAYNCMGCHTLVGNGAYLGPDLTEEYRLAGPAWLAAFLPSAGGWPTEAAVRTQLVNPGMQAEAGVDTIEAYLKKYPGAADRIARRGGGTTSMPNLPFTQEEIGKLLAYLKYTSAMNTEGWPAKILVKGDLNDRLRMAHGAGFTPTGGQVAPAAAVPTEAAATPEDPAVHGERLARDYGCIACHASDKQKLVGPGWGGLYGSQVKLSDGTSVTADDAYITESIVKPNAQIVDGYTPGVMPDYSTLLKEDEVKAIVSYIASLRGQEKQ